MKNFIRTVLNLDRRVIYSIVVFCVAGPLLMPVGLPFEAKPEVRGAWQEVEDLPEGSAVLISCDYGPASMAETHPMYVALLHQCFQNKLKPIVVSLVAGGDQMAMSGMTEVTSAADASGNPLYPDLLKGRDYSVLGYKTGTTAVMLALTQSFASTFPQDIEATPIADLQIFRNVRKLSDCKYMWSIASVGVPEYWLSHASQRTGVPLAVCCTAVSAPQYYPYYLSGQFHGLVGGMKGSAEYEKMVDLEKLIGTTGNATKGLDAQSLVHLFIVFAVILANACYFIERRMQAQEEEAG